LTWSGATSWILLNRIMTGDKFSSSEVSETASVSSGTVRLSISMMCFTTFAGVPLGKKSDCEPPRGRFRKQWITFVNGD